MGDDATRATGELPVSRARLTPRSLLPGLLFVATLFVPGEAAAQAVASDFTTGMRYDDDGRVTGVISPDPDGSGPLHYAAVRNDYDSSGRLVTVEKGELQQWQPDWIAPSTWPGLSVFSQMDIVYDGFGHKVRETLSSGGTNYQVTQFSYDFADRVECTAIRINPATWGALPASACSLTAVGSYGPDRITRNVYDSTGQLLKVTKAYGTALQQDYVTYTYTVNGKQATVKDADGNKAGYSYDGFDRLAQWNFPDKTTTGAVSTADYEGYGYDANGNRTSLRKRDGRTLTYTYDNLDRMTSKIIPDGCAPIQVGTCPPYWMTRDVYYSYDLGGRMLTAMFDAGWGITNVYDGFGRLASTTTNQLTPSLTLSYQYDADGNRTRITHPDGVYFSYAYDGLDREVAIAANGGAAVATTAYNAQGRVASATRGGVVTNYGYDPVSRLASLSDDLAGTTADVTSTFAYSPANQIVTRTRSNNAYAWSGYVSVSRSYTANGLNQYTSAGPATFAYDANGNLVSDGSGKDYIYGPDNLLWMVQASGTTAATLSYDPLGRLFLSYSPSTGVSIYLHDGDAIVAEYPAGNSPPTRRYVHGAGADTPLVWYEGAGLSDRRSLQADHQGSIVSVADASGAALAVNSYDEYGIPAAGNLGRFQYTGQAWLPELGMYYYKARLYSPTLARFMQTDPIGYADQNNLYAYVGNDPMNGTDPTGRCHDHYDNGSCMVRIAHSLEGDASAIKAQRAVEGTLNRYDQRVNAIPNKEVIPVKDSSGNGIGSISGKDFKRRWNGTSFTIMPNGTFHNGGAGGGTAHGKSGLEPQGVLGYIAHASSENEGADTIVFHELTHETTFGQNVIDINGGGWLTSGPLYDIREAQTNTGAAAVASRVGASFGCHISIVGCF